MLQIPVDRLRALCNPFTATDLWNSGGDLTSDMVACAIRRNLLNRNCNDDGRLCHPDHHAQRVAYFVVQGWDTAIDVDVGVPELCCHVDWLVQDGNHRLAAAIYRGDQFIKAGVSGSSDYMLELLGVKYEEPVNSE
jgi:hypothetical protein